MAFFRPYFSAEKILLLGIKVRFNRQYSASYPAFSDKLNAMHAILLHGMARSPLAMLVLAARLRKAGMTTHLFAYAAAFESWDGCRNRLQGFIQRRVANAPFVLIGHSLGSVLIRGILPRLAHKPDACFFLAPPTKACMAARKFAPRGIYKRITGEMGQLLARADFMDALPIPEVPTRIYAGINGPRGRYSPFGALANDGILALHETELSGASRLEVEAMHTFIMLNRDVTQDIIRVIRSLARENLNKQL